MSLADPLTDPAPSEAEVRELLQARRERGAYYRRQAALARNYATELVAIADTWDPPPHTAVPFDDIRIGDHVLLEQEWWKVIKREMEHDYDGRRCYLIAKPCEGHGQSIGHRHEIAEGQLVTRGAF